MHQQSNAINSTPASKVASETVPPDTQRAAVESSEKVAELDWPLSSKKRHFPMKKHAFACK